MCLHKELRIIFFRQDFYDDKDFAFPPARNVLACEAGGEERQKDQA